MIRQQAFIGNNKMLKGGLHCHTTRSDGKGTPEEVIKKHYDNGYSFLALTDHHFYNYKNYTDLPITIIPGMEINLDFANNDKMCCHTLHSVCIGPEENNGFKQDERYPYRDVKDQYDFQKDLDKAHENNNLTFYCHPEWSATPACEFRDLKGCFGMEIWNSGCVVENNQDTNAAYWDEVLYYGNKLYGIATDDGHAMYQHCMGWVMVNAENNVPAILNALKEGAFYSSTGPEIYDFYIEGNKAHIKCSPVKQIEYICWGRPSIVHTGDNLTEDENTDMPVDLMKYLRVSVIDEFGRRAWTNPIFFE